MSYKAANQFYFGILECESVSKINSYRSGASPIQALADAKDLIDNNLADAIFIFGYEPLLSNKKKHGKEEIAKAMQIFEEKSIIECYNLIAHELCKQLEISEEEFKALADALYNNYRQTFEKKEGQKSEYARGRELHDLKADLFKLNDCANPNIDFMGGIILANDNTADFLNVPAKKRIEVAGAKNRIVRGLPENIKEIVGTGEDIFPHLRKALAETQTESKISISEELKKHNLLLETYTCYPPIPLAFLLNSKIAEDAKELAEVLDKHEVTITGGMNFARAPWNNPALNGLIEMCDLLQKETFEYGVVHGNGGIGEAQGVAILKGK